MLIISKEFTFSASHVLHGLPHTHPCSRLHGHNYATIFELSADDEDLQPCGFVRDYRDLDVIKSWIDKVVDHRHLNDVLDGVNPSAENIARWLFDRWRDAFPELTSVRVSETPRTWAEFRPTHDRALLDTGGVGTSAELGRA